MTHKAMQEALHLIKAQATTTKFFLEHDRIISGIGNFVPICMYPPICTFTSKLVYNLESRCTIFMSNTHPETFKIDPEKFLKSSLTGRVLHISPLSGSYIYLLEILSATID